MWRAICLLAMKAVISPFTFHYVFCTSFCFFNDCWAVFFLLNVLYSNHYPPGISFINESWNGSAEVTGNCCWAHRNKETRIFNERNNSFPRFALSGFFSAVSFFFILFSFFSIFLLFFFPSFLFSFLIRSLFLVSFVLSVCLSHSYFFFFSYEGSLLLCIFLCFFRISVFFHYLLF